MKRSLAAAAVAHGALELAAALAGVEALARRRARLDDLGELALLLGGEEGDQADLVEVLADRIAHVCSSGATGEGGRWLLSMFVPIRGDGSRGRTRNDTQVTPRPVAGDS